MQQDDDNKIALWDGPTSQKKPIRKPNMEKPATVEIDVNKSTLSVDAKEWFPSPKPSQTTTTRQTAQDRLNRHKVAMPGNEPLYNQADHDFARLQELIVTMTYDPGQYEDILDTFLDIMDTYKNSDNIKDNLTQFIFSHAIKEASFRYNGARLCLVMLEQYPFFQPCLQKTCKLMFNDYQHNPGFTLFLAELFMQTEGDPFYGQFVFDAINNLLTVGDDDNVKTVCQALKLSGRLLEVMGKERMDGVFNKLHSVKQSVRNNIVNLIESVFTLRVNKWGQSTVTPTGTSSTQNGCNWNWIPPTVEKPTFYGPDGLELSMDEQKFLANQCGGYFDEAELEDPDELCDPEPEMDEEIQAAFREFVKLSK